MEEAVKEIAKVSLFSKMPKWLKVLLIIFSIITLVYWLGFMLYKILCFTRVVGAFIFEKRNYWTFLCCILILVIGGLLMAQFVFGLDPIGHLGEWFENIWQSIKNGIANKIRG